MNLRTLTFSVDLEKILDGTYQLAIAENISAIVSKFEKNHFLRTIRLSTVVLDARSLKEPKGTIAKIKTLSQFCKKHNIRWFSIALDASNEQNSVVDSIFEFTERIIASVENVFVNVRVTNDFVNCYAVEQAGETILRISKIDENGLANFRFGISCNVGFDTPFFPFCAASKPHGFSLAVETTQDLVDIAKKHSPCDPEQLKDVICKVYGPKVIELDNFAKYISSEFQVDYFGVDLSIAPFPGANISVLELTEAFGLKAFGGNGTVFTTAILTTLIKKILSDTKVLSVGFNGVMYSLLEDKSLCSEYDKRRINADSLMLFSTVCGCGIDMVPLPGETPSHTISALILDTAALSLKLKKPLGVRVLPIPNKSEGDATNLSLDFLTNTKIATLVDADITSSANLVTFKL